MMEEKEGWGSWWWEGEATVLHIVEDQKGGKGEQGWLQDTVHPQ